MSDDEDISIAGKTLCFSGTLSTQTRAQATKIAKEHGAKVTTSVSGNTDILVAGGGAGAKVKQAESKGVEVWTEDQFNAVVNEGRGGDDGEDNDDDDEGDKKRKAKEEEPEEAETPKKKKGRAAAKTTPKKAGRGSAAAAATTTPTKKKAPPAAAAATPGTPGSRKVMSAVAGGNEDYLVHGDYDVKLMLSDSLNANSNKYYKLQLLQDINDEGSFYVATNWGRLGESGQSQLKGPHDEDAGIKAFSKVFKQKTLNDWGAAPFVRHGHKYQIVDTTLDGDEDGDAALGRLTESQIHKGQDVLKRLREVLEDNSSKRRTTTSKVLGELSNEFYSLIPTTSGRQRPEPLNNLVIVTEKEGLLEFWLRMGFEEVGDGTVEGSPIEGVMDLPVPKTLAAAASSISDAGSISSSRKRGTELAKDGGFDMDAELYAAILLYTGNSIYRELNRCLRSEWKSARKYWNYLRLYFEAMDSIPSRKITLFRGIAADLFDEYEPGKTVTWWSVSSCTASKEVAQNFMNQLGSGTAASFITLHTLKACDVSSLSFYPHEKESLLRPGTRLKVMNRKRKGKVAEIEVQEVLAEN